MQFAGISAPHNAADQNGVIRVACVIPTEEECDGSNAIESMESTSVVPVPGIQRSSRSCGAGPGKGNNSQVIAVLPAIEMPEASPLFV
jgi:hypothetical protein